MTAPSHLRVEHRVDALGIGERRPRLSWRLPEGATAQTCYELSTDDGASVRVESEHATPHGPARVSWREGGPTEVVVPPGCTAEVVLRSGATATVGPGEHSFG